MGFVASCETGLKLSESKRGRGHPHLRISIPMNLKSYLFDKIITGAAGGAAALFLPRPGISPEGLVGFCAVFFLAAILALEYGIDERKPLGARNS
jgi:hypothetical protein